MREIFQFNKMILKKNKQKINKNPNNIKKKIQIPINSNIISLKK